MCSFPYVVVQVGASIYALAFRKEPNKEDVAKTTKRISYAAEWAFVVLQTCCALFFFWYVYTDQFQW